jgi:molecular chaperone HtpG
VEETEKDETGTEIQLQIKPNSEEENYDAFLEDWQLRQLVKRYSDYIRYPILLQSTKTNEEDAEENDESGKPVNSMSPIWRRGKSEVTKEEYEQFYKDTFHGFEAPLRVMHAAAEGTVDYRALLFLPAKAPYNYYSKDFEKGLRLYTSGVLIMEHCKDLLPDCFSFVQGVVDSQDLSLNISREMLQQDRQLKAIARHLEKKIKSELQALQEEDREGYHAFFKTFGLNLKHALYASYGMQRELLLDLLEFATTTQEQPATLKEYVARMPEAQKHIYYATGETAAQIKRLPQIERLTDMGYEVLCLTDDVDEFLMKMLHTAEEKELRSVSDADLELETEEEKQTLADTREADQALFAAVAEALGDRVSAVVPTARLKSHPVCLTSGSEGVSLEMERVLQSQPGAEDIPLKAERVLELNIHHPVYEKLKALPQDQMPDYAALLYNQALLIEGFPVEDPVEFSNAICRLMTE